MDFSATSYLVVCRDGSRGASSPDVICSYEFTRTMSMSLDIGNVSDIILWVVKAQPAAGEIFLGFNTALP